MIEKRLLRPERLRQTPPSFSWIDHRLVRDHYLERCDCTALALYLLLVTVSDAQGLSYYSEASLCRRLKLDPLQLSAARLQLEQHGLIAFKKPLYQVLSLEPSGPGTLASEPRSGQTLSTGAILKRALQGGGQ